MIHNHRITEKVVIIAHRGANDVEPENTLAAFQKAIEMNCDCVEMDVRCTRDGVLILMHDSTVNRTTNGSGKVHELTFDEIRSLDAGCRHGSGRNSQPVPTFDEALEVCKGKVRVYVDDKTDAPERVMTTIKQHQMLDEVIIYGSVENLTTFKRLYPAVWIMPDHPSTQEELVWLAHNLHPEALDGNIRDWTPEQVEQAHRLGIQVWVDNLGENDNPNGFQRSIEMGVDAIQTDHLGQLLEYLKRAGRR